MTIPTGVRHMLVATFFFSLMGLVVKSLSRLPVHEVVFFRAFVAILISIWFIRQRKVSFWGNNRKVLFLRGLFGTIALCLFFTTLHNLPLATAVTIQYLSPIFTAIFARFLLGEEIEGRQWFYFLLSFAGVVMIKGFDPRVNWIYLGAGVGAAFSAALAYSCISHLKETEDPHVIIFYFPLVTVPLIAPYTVTHWAPPTAIEWGGLILVGIIVQIAQYFMTLAYQREKAGMVSIVSYVGVILALIYGMIFFGEEMTAGSLAGMGLVVTGVILNTLVQSRDK